MGENNVPISGDLIQEKALKFAAEKGIKDFFCVWWLVVTFQSRILPWSKNHFWRGRRREHGPSVEQWQKEAFPTFIKGYSDDQIYNSGETGLFHPPIKLQCDFCHCYNWLSMILTVILNCHYLCVKAFYSYSNTIAKFALLFLIHCIVLFCNPFRWFFSFSCFTICFYVRRLRMSMILFLNIITKKKKMVEILEFDLTTLGFNVQNTLVPWRTLNRVPTVWYFVYF